MEAETKKNQLEEFLDQFDINGAEIKGIGPTIKTTLLSHGVETAADVNEYVGQVPFIGDSRAERLLVWRRDLERKFVFDPARGVPPEARVRTEREVDALRFRLESELSGGAHYLRRVKQEIETSRQRLQPILTQARQELAQAEKDLQVASKRNSPALILTLLIVAFFIGWAIESGRGSPEIPVEIQREDSGSQPPPASRPDHEALADQKMRQMAIKFYSEGERLSKEGRFAEAVEEFQKAIDTDSNLKAAYEELGYALYRLKRYEESAEASKAAIRLRADFKPFYILGLVHFATENWHGAMLAFRQSIVLRDTSSWKDEYTEAYYYLGLSLAKLGDVHSEIQALEADVGFLRGEAMKRFELANLYLCVGWGENAREQYRLLKNSDQALAKELLKLMKKHGVRRPAG